MYRLARLEFLMKVVDETCRRRKNEVKWEKKRERVKQNGGQNL